MWDKQLGRDSASMFIFEFALSANVALYYVLFHFVAKAKEKTFSEVDSLSALADTYNEFPYRTKAERFLLIFLRKSILFVDFLWEFL